MNKLKAYLQLMRFDKPVGTLLLLWPTWWALWIASHGAPGIKFVIIFTLGVVIMRALGCVVNDIADRHLDKAVARTQNRPLAANVLTLKEALACLVILSLIALLLVLMLDWQTIGLSIIALLLASVYPLMKRFTHWPQVVLGLAFNWGIIMVFSAVRGNLPAEAWLLYTIGVLWTIAYDTIYAMVDREDDLKIGIKSTAVLLQHLEVPFIAGLYGCVVIGFVLLGIRLDLGFFYYVALCLPVSLLIYQIELIRSRERETCLYAFKVNQVVGLLVFLALFLGY